MEISKASIHDVCVEAVNLMVEEGIEKHISFISGEDSIRFGLKEGGRIPKVTIEWVDASEALTKPEIDELSNIVAPLRDDGCICGSKDDHHTVECYLGK